VPRSAGSDPEVSSSPQRPSLAGCVASAIPCKIRPFSYPGPDLPPDTLGGGLAAATGAVTAEAAEQAETKLQTKKSMWLTKRWRKWRDAPLAESVAYKLRRRAGLGMADPAVVEARIDRIRRRTK
jgi:hypothetical protein